MPLMRVRSSALPPRGALSRLETAGLAFAAAGFTAGVADFFDFATGLAVVAGFADFAGARAGLRFAAGALAWPLPTLSARDAPGDTRTISPSPLLWPIVSETEPAIIDDDADGPCAASGSASR